MVALTPAMSTCPVVQMQIEMSDQQARLIVEALEHYGLHLGVLADDAGNHSSNLMRHDVAACELMIEKIRELL